MIKFPGIGTTCMDDLDALGDYEHCHYYESGFDYNFTVRKMLQKLLISKIHWPDRHFGTPQAMMIICDGLPLNVVTFG